MTTRMKMSDWFIRFYVRLEDPDLYCSCGNPNCDSHVQFRKGYVQIHKPDGTKEVRWDYFYIDAIDSIEPKNTKRSLRFKKRTCDDCGAMQEKGLCKEAAAGKSACPNFFLLFGHKDRKTRFVQVMLPPEQAQELMWYLITEYFPGVSQALNAWNDVVTWVRGRVM